MLHEEVPIRDFVTSDIEQLDTDENKHDVWMRFDSLIACEQQREIH